MAGVSVADKTAKEFAQLVQEGSQSTGAQLTSTLAPSSVHKLRYHAQVLEVGTLTEQVQRVPALLAYFQQTFPGAVTNIEYEAAPGDETKKIIKHMVVVLPYAAKVTINGPRIMSIDYAHMRTGESSKGGGGGGLIMVNSAAVGAPVRVRNGETELDVDGNANCTYLTLAVGWTQGNENAASMRFVLDAMVAAGCFQAKSPEELRAAGYDTETDIWVDRYRTFNIIADGGGCIEAAIGDLKPTLNAQGVILHRFRDVWHLHKNVVDAARAGGTLVAKDAASSLLGNLAAAAMQTTVARYEAKVDEFKSEAHKAKHGSLAEYGLHFLGKYDNADWLSAFCPTSTWRYGVITSNASEAINGAVVPQRAQGPFHGIRAIVFWAMERYINLCSAVHTDITSRAAAVPTYGKLAVEYAQNTDKKKRWKAERVGTDMVVSNKSKKSTAPHFIVNIAAGTCSCGEPQTVGTACVHALVAIEASTAAGARQLLKTNKFFAIGLRASDAAMAFDATAAATLSVQMKAGASVEWRHLQVSEQIVWPIAKRKRDDAAGDAPGDASTASTSTSTGSRASGRFLGSIDFLPK
jgi:hypothetical protein